MLRVMAQPVSNYGTSAQKKTRIFWFQFMGLYEIVAQYSILNLMWGLNFGVSGWVGDELFSFGFTPDFTTECQVSLFALIPPPSK